MPDYEKMYFILFNHITDAIKLLDKSDVVSAKELLISAQQKTEELYIKDDE